MQASQPDAFIVTIQKSPAPAAEWTVADVILGSLSTAAMLLLIAIALGGVCSLVLVKWRRRFPIEQNHLPPVSPLIPDPTVRPTSQAR